MNIEDCVKRSAQTRNLAIFLAYLIPMLGCAMTPNNQPQETPNTKLVVSTQSIGRGVPENTRMVFAKIKNLLNSAGLHPVEESWGIEGEKRICVRLTSEQRRTLMGEINALTKDTKLLNIEVLENSSEQCK